MRWSGRIITAMFRRKAFLQMLQKSMDEMEWSNSSQPRSTAKLFETASAGRQLQATVVAVEETQHLQAMQALWTQFTAIRPVVDRVLEGNLSSVALDNVTTYAAAVEVPIESATNLYSSMTQTATMTPINLLVPLPMQASGHLEAR